MNSLPRRRTGLEAETRRRHYKIACCPLSKRLLHDLLCRERIVQEEIAQHNVGQASPPGHKISRGPPRIRLDLSQERKFIGISVVPLMHLVEQPVRHSTKCRDSRVDRRLAKPSLGVEIRKYTTPAAGWISCLCHSGIPPFASFQSHNGSIRRRGWADS